MGILIDEEAYEKDRTLRENNHIDVNELYYNFNKLKNLSISDSNIIYEKNQFMKKVSNAIELNNYTYNVSPQID